MQEKHTVLGAGSVHVCLMSPASFVHIDSATVDALELVKPLRAGNSQRSKATTLFNLLNHTKTACGAKLLRVAHASADGINDFASCNQMKSASAEPSRTSCESAHLMS